MLLNFALSAMNEMVAYNPAAHSMLNLDLDTLTGLTPLKAYDMLANDMSTTLTLTQAVRVLLMANGCKNLLNVLGITHRKERMPWCA